MRKPKGVSQMPNTRDSGGRGGGNRERGFAAMDEEKQREIAQKGGEASHGGKSGGGQSSGQRGFAAMDEERQREIASQGGKAAHEKGTAHEFTSEEAREAGRKGGQAVSQD